MIVLAFDTAMAGCSCAVLRDGAELAGERVAMTFGQAEALLPMVERVMTAGGVAFADLDLIAVTVGPGSFTGLRVGLAAALGLSLASGAPAHGVTTTEALAHRALAARPGHPIVVAVDSRREEPFVQVFDAAGRAMGEVLALSPEAAAARCPAGPLTVTGDAAERLIAALGDRAVARVEIVLPDPAIIAAIAWARRAAPLAAEPLYVRPPDAAPPGDGGRVRP